MPYETNSPNAPETKTDITSSLIQRLKNNPYGTGAIAVQWPDKYDSFVAKTNDQMTPVLVEDETWALADIDQDNQNKLELNHQPVFGTEVVVSDGTLLDLTDYQHGYVYFDTLPTGDFTVQYQANPDKYWGEWITALQEVLHQLEWYLGAGQTLNEGVRNCELFLDSLPAEIQARLPHAVHIRAIDRDIEIRSTTDTGSPNGIQHSITLGNGEDHVYVDAKYFVVRRSLVTGPGPSYLNTRIGDETGDKLEVAGNTDLTGLTRIGTPHTSANTGITDPVVTGFEGTGLPYTSGSLRLAVYGDQAIFGDLHVLGQVITYNTEVNIQVNVYEDDLEIGNDLFVQHDVRLGSSTDDEVAIAGDLDETGDPTFRMGGARGTARFDGSIEFTDGALKGPYQQCTVDGLDPSYQEMVRPLQRDGWKDNYLNHAQRAAEYSGTTTAAGSTSTLVDTATSSLTGYYPTGTYYSSKYDDGDFVCEILSGDAEGEIVPVKSFDPSTKTWTLARALSTAAGSGAQYRIVHRLAHGDFLAAGVGLNVTIRGSDMLPLVACASGIIKKRVSDYSLAVPAASTVYVFMTNQPGVNGIDQDEPTFFYATSPIESDRSVLIGKVVTDGSSVTSVTCYDINGRYDTQWVKFATSPTGNEQAIGTDYSVAFMFGNRKRVYDADVRVLAAADLTGGGTHPDLDQIVEVPMDQTGIFAQRLGLESTVFKTAQIMTPPFWLRFISE